MAIVTNRSRLLLLAAGSTLAMGIAIACSFPDPALVPDGAEGGGPDATPDAVDGDGGRPDVIVEPDAPPPIDATSEKPPVDANCNVCDCDNDGFKTRDAASGCTDAGAGPYDCDDLDKRAFPDAGFVHELPTLDTQGDWNCDTKVNREFKVNIKCADYGGVLFSSCSSIEGFVSDPQCGAKATYVFCKPTGVSDCVEGRLPSEERTQGCK